MAVVDEVVAARPGSASSLRHLPRLWMPPGRKKSADARVPPVLPSPKLGFVGNSVEDFLKPVEGSARCRTGARREPVRDRVACGRPPSRVRAGAGRESVRGRAGSEREPGGSPAGRQRRGQNLHTEKITPNLRR
ncbi:MAG: hypothetical protein JWR69_167 [Pedosphaera sp.]|nr:hypothetical protein [Pedosphaera sp.]